MSNTLAAVIHLLDIYPESAHMNSSNGSNILFCATMNGCKDSNIAVEKTSYLYKRFPTFLCPCNDYGSSMLVDAIKQSSHKISLFLCEMDEQQQLIRHKTIRPFPFDDNLSLPLHTLVQSKIRNTHNHQIDLYTFAPRHFKPVSDEADCFRLLITR